MRGGGGAGGGEGVIFRGNFALQNRLGLQSDIVFHLQIFNVKMTINASTLTREWSF